MNDMENTDEIIRLVAKEAIKEFDKEQKEKKKKKVFHNTKLLLKHYNSLKTHVRRLQMMLRKYMLIMKQMIYVVMNYILQV